MKKKSRSHKNNVQGYNSVYVTTSSVDEANLIAKHLVEKRLAACANIVPKINSIYWWEGKLCQDQEALIFIKTTKKLVEKVIKEIKKIHSYEVPAIVALDISRGNSEFLEWISGEVDGEKTEKNNEGHSKGK